MHYSGFKLSEVGGGGWLGGRVEKNPRAPLSINNPPCMGEHKLIWAVSELLNMLSLIENIAILC